MHKKMPKFMGSKGNSNERSLYVHWLGNIKKSYKTHANGDKRQGFTCTLWDWKAL